MNGCTPELRNWITTKINTASANACTTKGERVTASRTVMSQRLGRKWVT